MATQLADGIWWFELSGVNAYLVEDDVLTLVDAGTPFDAATIEAEVEGAGHRVSEIERVLLTHYDFDHVGALAKLDDLDATVYAGRADAAVLTGDEKPRLGNRKGAFQRVAGPFVDTPDLPVEIVADGDTVGSFTAYHTPGHTPGHTAFVSETLSAGFFGDLVFEGSGRLTPSGWAMSHDTDTVAESIRSVDERVPAFSVLGMGHGVPFVRDGDARLADLAADR
ncbi:MBL fold metallo-hydrolase [Halococcus salsus]|uniref:MBL fold metallo-hydrolase n=1 Tax=Halococcus salsus TaxID=2162894 RepID=UPI00135ABD31|nr:MBL fold metallo-hydrolase [Halococcus salsus]